MARIRVAVDRRGYRLRDSWGRVPARTRVLRSVDLHQLRVVHVSAESVLYGGQIGLKAITAGIDFYAENGLVLCL